jgi:hypothetical protein
VGKSLDGGCENSLVSNSTPPPPGTDRSLRAVPGGEEVGRFDHYDDARALVGRLLGGGISPRQVSIIGSGVTAVERIIARYGYGRAAMTSALTGSWVGVFAGLLFATVSPSATLAPLLAGGLIGAGVGMMAGMLLYTTRGANRPLYRSTQQLIASSYQVIVDPAVAGKARQLAASPEGGE